MSFSILRNAGVVLGGLVAGSVVNMAIITFNSHVLYPMPEDVSMTDQEGFGKYIESLPIPAYFVVFLAHFGQALVGGMIAAKYGDKDSADPMVLSQIVGGLTLAGAVVNAMSLPVPKWTWIEMPLFPVVAWYAVKTVEKLSGSDTASPKRA